MPSIEALHRHFKGQGLAVLTVSVNMAEAEIVRAFVQKHNYTFTVLHDPQKKIMEWFRVRLIPVTYVINKSGKIIGKAIGIRDWGQEHMIRLCGELLKSCDEKP